MVDSQDSSPERSLDNTRDIPDLVLLVNVQSIDNQTLEHIKILTINEDPISLAKSLLANALRASH